MSGALDETLMSLMKPEEAAAPEPVVEVAPETEPAVPALPTWIVKEQSSNVRERPTTDSPVVGVVRHGMVLTEVSRDGNWVKIQIPDETTEGWIHSRMLTEQEPTAGQ
jgi:uncharacterized protein YgiM (DUF1202 family)